MYDPDVLRELGRLSGVVDGLREDGRRRDDKLDLVLEKLEPVPGLVDDVAEIKPKVARLEAEGYRRAGVIATICTAVGLFGVQGIEWIVQVVKGTGK